MSDFKPTVLASILTVLIANTSTVSAIDLPKEYELTEDGQQLLRGKKEPKGFYSLDNVDDVYLEFSEDNWFEQLESIRSAELQNSGQSSAERLSATLTYDDKTIEGVGVQFKGFTSFYRADTRKSFDIDLDFTDEEADIDGYDKLNLNNAFEDPTYIREVLYSTEIRKHTPAARSNFINLYINGEFWGMYSNTQQLDKKFLKQWFSSNDGANFRAAREQGSNLSHLGADANAYEQAFQLKSGGDVEVPYAVFSEPTRLVDNITAETVDDLNQVMDVDGTLWFLAYEILFGDDDSYAWKGGMDYMLYFDEGTGRILPYEVDGNSVMIKEFDLFMQETPHPLHNKLLAIPELRQRYLAHVRTILQESFAPTYMHERIDDLQALADDGVRNDPRPHEGFSYEGLASAIEELKSYADQRYQLLTEHDELNNAQAPLISEQQYAVNQLAFRAPDANEEVTLTAKVTHDQGVQAVYAYHAKGVMGVFDKTQMFDDGEHGDGQANDGVYGVSLAGQDAGTYVRYYFEAIADDNAGDWGTMSYLPAGAEHDVFIYRVNLAASANRSIAINELMASNDSTVSDEQGEFDDWVELYNTTAQSISLAGYYLSDDDSELDKWPLPNVTIEPFGHVAFWLDDDEEQGEEHANFKLSADGEELILINPEGTVEDSVRFEALEADQSYGRVVDGSGEFSVISPTYNSSNGEATNTVPTPTPTPTPVTTPPETACVEGVMDFNQVALTSFGDQDISGSSEVLDEGCTLTLSGNSWKFSDYQYFLTTDTVLVFDFMSTDSDQGEVHGIALHESNPETGDGGRTFQVYGSQDWGIRDYTYTQVGEYQTFEIPVGRYLGRRNLSVSFANDDDFDANAKSYFRNVRFIERPQ